MRIRVFCRFDKGSILDLSNARRADHLTLEFCEIFGAAAEKACILVFFKYNFVALNIDFYRV